MEIRGRKVDYLRISITDRCNEKCLYCMPEGFSDWKAREDILTYEEILRVVRVALKLGFQKFRITGGEPLVRKEVPEFIRKMKAIPGVRSVSMTTNATRLESNAKELFEAGLDALNISLDALDPDLYRKITGGEVTSVLHGISKARTVGFKNLKLNTVLIRGMNEKEIWPLVQYASERSLPVRFIELMPLSRSDVLDDSNFLPVGEVMQLLRTHDNLIPMDEVAYGHGPARYYRLERTGAIVGFIGAMTNLHFCESCNKIRLTADGKIRPCLGNHGEYDLLETLRSGGDDDRITEIFCKALDEKPPEHLFRENYQPGRIMTQIGG